MQRWDDELIVSGHDAEFQQRVIAATLPHDPKLEIAQALFALNGEEAENEDTPVDGEGIFMPTTDGEFQEMLKLFAEDLRED